MANMNTLSKKFSSSTSQLAKQAAEVAATTFHAANNAFTAGLRTCEERGSSKTFQDAEIRIGKGGQVTHHDGQDTPRSLPPSTSGSLLRGGSLLTPPQGSAKPPPYSTITLVNEAVAASSAAAKGVERSQGEVWGTHNFEFTFRAEASGFLMASAMTLPGGQEVPLRCRWQRKVCGERLFEMQGVITSSYQLSADDIGCHIIVEASPFERDFSLARGIAYGELGPFEMDAATRKSLDQALACESSRFPVRKARGTPHDKALDDDNLMLHVTTTEVKIIKPGPGNVGFTQEWVGRYGAEWPQIQLDLFNQNNFQVFLGPKSADRLDLCALSRSQRDLIALTVRCFHARQYIATSAVVEQITQQTLLRGGAAGVPLDSVGTLEPSLNLFVIVQRLMGELNRALEQQERITRERRMAVIEKEALEQDISATIEAYQQLLLRYQKHEENGNTTEDFLKDSTKIADDLTKRAAHVADLENRLKDSQAQCRKYIDQLELLRRDFRTLQEKVNRSSNDPVTLSFSESSTYIPSAETLQKVLQLENQIEILSQKNFHLTQKDKEHNESATKLREEVKRLRKLDKSQTVNGSSILEETLSPEVRSKELLRLKKEVETLSYDKQSIQTQYNALQADNKELTENFLYIKEKYDSLKSQQSALDESMEKRSTQMSRDLRIARQKITDLEQDLQHAQRTIDAAIADKNRLSKKNESLTKDLTKNRGELEETLQKLSHTTNQLVEEKKMAETQVKNLETTVQSQKSQILSMENSSALSVVHTADGPDLVTLLEQLREKDHIIKKLENENATLKSRVRKLAAVNK